MFAEVGGQALDEKKIYVLATRGYMARGKDGYKSLLVKPEGGECEEVVAEENGMLISAMLRQYFMSLKIMDQWNRWTPSLAQHWNRVGSDLHRCHPVLENPSGSLPASPARDRKRTSAELVRKESWAEWSPAKLREKRDSVGPLAESGGEEDSEDGGEEEEAREGVQELDRELRIMRHVFHKWCRLAGVQGKTCDNLNEAEIGVAWTKAIAPRVEGRIQMVGDGDTK